MFNEIVFASSNQGKIKEVTQILTKLNIKVISQSELNVPEVAETGLTFIENAIIKARHCCSITGLPALADDSGLEVDALNGSPGIYSARYAGSGKSTDNNKKLLSNLIHISKQKRSARFQCLMTLMRHQNDPVPFISQGTWEGRITETEIGEHGFGYDPVFFVPDHLCTAAELDVNVKNKISHRGQALHKLYAMLASFAG